MRRIHLESFRIPALQQGWHSSRILDVAWLIMMGFCLVYAFRLLQSGWVCAYMGTDFRGYYASAQIAWQRGFAQVYDQDIQNEYQATIFHQCPASDVPQPIPRVSTPYLPVFILLFLPLVFFDFTASYLLWVFLNLCVLVIYLIHFSNALNKRLPALRLVQWAVCVPVISNLFLGQMNVWMLICLGEFFLLLLKGHRLRGGLWLGGMLLKPHTLLLLLPGLVLSQNWAVLLGFFMSLTILLGVSALLSGIQGLAANASVVIQFAGPLIKTASSMMNYRALALYLEIHLPAWVAWGLTFIVIALVLVAVLKQWLRGRNIVESQMSYVLIATLAGTFVIAWHAHFYLLICLIPLLMHLDLKHMLPLSVLAVWLFAPFVLYGLIVLLKPDFTRSLFGLGMLALSQFLLAWATWRLSKAQR